MSPQDALTSADDLIPVGAYLRVSEDKSMKAGAASWREIGEEVDAQLEELTELAAQLGWKIVVVYNDNNTVATDPFIVRKDFERLLLDLQEGAVIRGLLGYHSDRIARLEYDAARLNRLFQMNPKLVGRTYTGGVDFATQEGRTMFMMQATMGGMEVANNKRRTTRKRKRLAEAGVMPGAPRPFGWADDRENLHPVESIDLADAIRAVPGGKKVGTVRKEWALKGYVKKQTKKSIEKHGKRDLPLDHTTVEHILTNPRNCGYMTHIPQSERREAKKKLWLPDYVVYKDGKPVMGPWKPIVTPEEWAACVEAIADRKAKRAGKLNKPHETSDKYLLSGIARCGKCLFPLTANWYSKQSSSYERYGYRYACLSNLGGCGGVTRVGPPIEELVIAVFLEEVRRSLGVVVKADEVDETVHDSRLAEIEEEIEEVNQRRKAKRLSMAKALDLIEELETERAELKEKRQKLMASKLQRKTEYPTLLKEWENYTVSEKKHRIKQDIRAVIVHPQGRGRQPFNPELIEIEWAS
ncbi:recombinase family protein [Actinomadura sp. NPDC048021]|uniref:recombinase family protein n=1 Tax=Actinomadura sp. NPDC048021 TaxID=3155385 RepID=UPI0033CA48BC